ncbi:MAG: segregation/condensation protein A, partial [Candidatus Omnitrophota bacterium]
PRAELVKRLLEYKKFKEVAQDLHAMERQNKDFFGRGQKEKPDSEEKGDYFEANLFDLITAFSKILRDIPKEVFHQFVKDEFTVSEKIHEILHALVKKTTLYFTELFNRARSKGEVVAIFLAILELIRLREIVIIQKVRFGEIEIMRNADSMRAV